MVISVPTAIVPVGLIVPPVIAGSVSVPASSAIAFSLMCWPATADVTVSTLVNAGAVSLRPTANSTTDGFCCLMRWPLR